MFMVASGGGWGSAEARGPPPTLLPVTASYQDFLTTWLASLVLWVPVDIVLFRFVPVAAQVYVVKSIDIIALLGFSYFVNKHPSPRPPRAQGPRPAASGFFFKGGDPPPWRGYHPAPLGPTAGQIFLAPLFLGSPGSP